VAGAQQPYKTLKELVAAAKAKPGEIAYGSLGVGSTSHLTMEAFASAAGIKLNHIPFKGSGEAQTQLMGGNVPVMSDTVPGILSQVKPASCGRSASRFHSARLFSPMCRRSPSRVIPGSNPSAGSGSRRLRRRPVAILDKLNAEIRKMLASPDVKEKFNQLAFVPVGDSRQEFAAFIRGEIAKWSKVAKESGAKAD
jgi:tripartite-type tricarboxylate transporter receptor subunit TctC